MKAIGFKINEELAKEIENIYPSLGNAAATIFQALLSLRNTVIHTLQGKFTKGELKYQIDLYNGALFDPQRACYVGIHAQAVKESDKYQGLGERHKVDVDQLCKKIEELTPGQVYFLQEWLYLFWNGPSEKEVEEYITELL